MLRCTSNIFTSQKSKSFISISQKLWKKLRTPSSSNKLMCSQDHRDYNVSDMHNPLLQEIFPCAYLLVIGQLCIK